MRGIVIIDVVPICGMAILQLAPLCIAAPCLVKLSFDGLPVISKSDVPLRSLFVIYYFVLVADPVTWRGFGHLLLVFIKDFGWVAECVSSYGLDNFGLK
jgi:hypothetical protein